MKDFQDLTSMDHLTQKDAKAVITVEQDRMSAEILLEPPENFGIALGAEELAEALRKKGVVFGVRENVIVDLARNPVYGRPFVIAEGEDRVDGTDASLTYHFQKEKDLRPKINANGKVDFKDLGIVEQVAKGALLCEKQPATPGKPGTNVLGRPILQKRGKDVAMPRGKNTVLSEDKLKLYAEIDGQVEYVNFKVNVLNLFTVEDDVGNATGNIDFIGNVLVTGGVHSGFSVKATGNIDIYGMVESATIKADGSVLIRGGFNGVDKGSIEAGENVTCKFIQGGSVSLRGNLETTYILNATVRCSGAVNLSGKGMIMGGHVAAHTLVSAVTLGSASAAANTVIEVGNDPILAMRYRDLPKEIQDCTKEIHSAQSLATTLLQLQKAGRLSEKNAENLQKTLRSLQKGKNRLLELEQEYEIVKQRFSGAGKGMVKVSKTAHPGVRIIIGSEQLLLQTEQDFVCFTRKEGGISAGPLR